MQQTSRSLARAVVGRVPPFARVLADRDRWRGRAETARRELQSCKAERDSLRRELKAARSSAGGQTATAAAAAGRSLPVAPDAEVTQEFPPGHYYSPIADLREVRSRADSIFDRSRTELPGIDLRHDSQLALLPEFERFYEEMPFQDEPGNGLRYGFVNRFFSHGDGLALYSMLRHLRPRRVVEVGSGWSSALTLDVNDRFFDGSIECTFIEPYPDRLNELLSDRDAERVRIVAEPLYAAGQEAFDQLEAGDLLFIDSTHVSRVGSDVNQLLLEVVPRLPEGVTVHLHDVFWPFEYPAYWVYGGRSWTEDYLLRALLVDNPRLQILWFNDFLAEFSAAEVEKALPGWSRNPGGSIYLRTVRPAG